MRASHRSATALGVATIGLVTAGGMLSPAQADSLECGDQISTNTVLTHDLVCGSGDALVIVANGVTLDLGGHSITGPGAYSPGVGSGVRAAQRTEVTVVNGTISGFQSAVVLDQSSDSHVTKLTVFGNDQAINIAGGGGHLIDKNTVVNNRRDSIRLGSSHGNHVTQNSVTGNVFGIAVADGSSHNLVDRNVATGNERFGVAVWGGGSDNVVAKTQASGNGFHGIQVNSDDRGVLLIQNSLSSNGHDGIHVESTYATITRNTAVFNGALGISAPDGVIDGGGNKASGNGDPRQCTGVACDPAF